MTVGAGFFPEAGTLSGHGHSPLGVARERNPVFVGGFALEPSYPLLVSAQCPLTSPADALSRWLSLIRGKARHPSWTATWGLPFREFTREFPFAVWRGLQSLSRHCVSLLLVLG